MFALSVIANPNPDSLGHAMARVARDALEARGWSVSAHDLYAEGFDPVRRAGETSTGTASEALVERHCAELSAADLILVFHPNWWGQPPAIMKGWIDRVFRLGVAYGYPPGVPPEGVPVGLLRARCGLVFNTSNTPLAREQEAFGDPLEAIWRHCVFGLCGVHDVRRLMVGPVSGSSDVQRRAWLDEVARRVAEEGGRGG